MAKNCNTCKHLAFHWDDTDGFHGPNSGYGCDKRDPSTPAAEKILIANLARDEYRNRYKRCFEQRGQSSAREGAERSGNAEG